MKISIYDQRPIQEIKDELGWWSHSENGVTSEEISNLITVCMLLCDKISDLEVKIALLKKRNEHK